jgi:hypothetical protein
MAQPASFENFFRIHDEALMNWLQGFTVDYNDAGGLFGRTPISSLSQSSSVATCVTSSPHGLTAGNTFVILGVSPTGWNGNWTVLSVTSATQFTFNVVGNPASATSFGTATITRNNQPIISVYSSPDRAFAAASDLLIRTGWIPGLSNSAELDNVELLNGLPLPLCSVWRTNHERDPSMQGVPKQIASDSTHTHYYPLWMSYWLYYDVSFWSQKKYTQNFAMEWMEAQFGTLGNLGNECFIPVVHNPPFGQKTQSLQLESYNDNSDLEGNDPRYMRWDYSLRLRGWFQRNLIS